MARRADKLRQALNASKKTAAETRRAFMKAEDVLTDLEARESRRAARNQQARSR